MKEINIQANGFVIDDKIRKHILQRLHSVFGFEQHQIKKIVITLFAGDDLDDEIENHCSIEIKIKDHPAIITQLKSFDIYQALTIAIERAHLKVSRRSKGENNIRKQVEYNKRSAIYG